MSSKTNIAQSRILGNKVLSAFCSIVMEAAADPLLRTIMWCNDEVPSAHLHSTRTPWFINECVREDVQFYTGPPHVLSFIPSSPSPTTTSPLVCGAARLATRFRTCPLRFGYYRQANHRGTLREWDGSRLKRSARKWPLRLSTLYSAQLDKFPDFKEVLLQYNTPLPSSGPVERLFSSGRQILVPRRNRLSDDMFETMLLLKGNKSKCLKQILFFFLEKLIEQCVAWM